MSIRVMTTVWDKSTRTGTNLLALLALADRANDDGYCYPGIASIAAKTRIKERQCVNVIQSLEASGELFVDRGVGRHGTSKYLILIGLTEAEITGRLIYYFDCPKKDAPAIASQLFKKVQASAPLSTQTKKVQFLTKKMQTLTNKGAIQRQKGATVIAPDPSVSIIDPSLIHQFAANAAATLEPSPSIQTPTEPEGEPAIGTSSPLQQSPIDDDVPPAPAKKPAAQPKAPRQPDPVFDKLCSMTQSVAAMHGGMIGTTRKTINKDTEHPCTVANLEAFGLWWCSTFYSKGDAVPTLGQISQRWGVAMAWADKHAPKPAPIVEKLSPEESAALEAKLIAEYEAHEAEMNRRRIAAGYIKA